MAKYMIYTDWGKTLLVTPKTNSTGRLVTLLLYNPKRMVKT